MNVLTIDVEDWFHILDLGTTREESAWGSYESRIDGNVGAILDVLARKRVRATFFCLGWVARKHPHVVKRIFEAGHEIACHSDSHQLVYEQSREAFGDDLRMALSSIENTIGKKVRAYRAPGFSITKDQTWAFEALLENGIEIDCSVFPATRGHGGFPEFQSSGPCRIWLSGRSLKEFPINTWSVLGRRLIFSGGGYFRLLPYWLLQRLWRRADYVMTYFHPRDFDPSQPLVQGLPFVRRFKSYYGLSFAMSKFERLLDEFQFVDLRSADRLVDWMSVPEIQLHASPTA
jgi:polysaccharide deacetylase family protein (PEP-CTERM system associated)